MRRRKTLPEPIEGLTRSLRYQKEVAKICGPLKRSSALRRFLSSRGRGSHSMSVRYERKEK